MPLENKLFWLRQLNEHVSQIQIAASQNTNTLEIECTYATDDRLNVRRITFYTPWVEPGAARDVAGATKETVQIVNYHHLCFKINN